MTEPWSSTPQPGRRTSNWDWTRRPRVRWPTARSSCWLSAARVRRWRICLAANEVFLAADDLVFAAQCQGDLATAHRQLGEFSVALAILEEARRSLDELGAHAEADRLRLALAETYLALSLFPEARAAAAASADWTAGAAMVHDHGHAQLVLGLSFLASGDATEADAHLARAEAAYEEVSDRQHLARTQLARAEAAGLAGRFADATAAAERAAMALEAGGWLPSLAWSHLRRLDWTDDPQALEPLLTRASELVEHLRLPNLTFAYELRRARWLRRSGRPVRAQEALRGRGGRARPSQRGPDRLRRTGSLPGRPRGGPTTSWSTCCSNPVTSKRPAWCPMWPSRGPCSNSATRRSGPAPGWRPALPSSRPRTPT